jgi:hypothetical protein
MRTFSHVWIASLALLVWAHDRYLHPQTWHEITDELGALGVVVGIVDGYQSGQVFHDLSITGCEMRGYYRGRTVRGPSLTGGVSVGDIRAWVAQWLAASLWSDPWSVLFGPMAPLAALGHISDVAEFVTSHVGDTQDRRARLLYLATDSDVQNGESCMFQQQNRPTNHRTNVSTTQPPNHPSKQPINSIRPLCL